MKTALLQTLLGALVYAIPRLPCPVFFFWRHELDKPSKLSCAMTYLTAAANATRGTPAPQNIGGSDRTAQHRWGQSRRARLMR